MAKFGKRVEMRFGSSIAWMMANGIVLVLLIRTGAIGQRISPLFIHVKEHKKHTEKPMMEQRFLL